MKRVVLLCLLSCLTIGILACSGVGTGTPVPTPLAQGTVTTTPTATVQGTVAPTPTPVVQGTVPPSPVLPGAPSPTIASSSTGEAAVVTSYYQAVAAQNYQLAFSFLDATATGPDGQRLTWQGFLKLAQLMDGEGGTVTNFSIVTSGSMVVMTINRQKVGPYHAHLQMKQEGNGWKIRSIDRI